MSLKKESKEQAASLKQDSKEKDKITEEDALKEESQDIQILDLEVDETDLVGTVLSQDQRYRDAKK